MASRYEMTQLMKRCEHVIATQSELFTTQRLFELTKTLSKHQRNSLSMSVMVDVSVFLFISLCTFDSGPASFRDSPRWTTTSSSHCLSAAFLATWLVSGSSCLIFMISLVPPPFSGSLFVEAAGGGEACAKQRAMA